MFKTRTLISGAICIIAAGAPATAQNLQSRPGYEGAHDAMGFDRVPQPWIFLNPTGDAEAGIQSDTIIIDSPGSYILTGNILGRVGQNGIEIHSGNVSLDLGGWSIRGVSGSLDGVTIIGPERANIRINNGSVTLWGEDGIDLTKARNSRVDSVRVSANGGYGIILQNGVISVCSARNNGIDGMKVSQSSVIVNSTSVFNGDDGFDAGPGSTIRNCTTDSNADHGIVMHASGMVIGSTAWANGNRGINAGTGVTIEGCNVAGNAAMGINAGTGSVIKNTISMANGSDGIRVRGAVRVEGNTVSDNVGAGIRLTQGSGARIESNTCTENQTGYLIAGGGNIVIKNTAHGNADNFNISESNHFGRIVNLNSESFNTPNAWANFVY